MDDETWHFQEALCEKLDGLNHGQMSSCRSGTKGYSDSFRGALSVGSLDINPRTFLSFTDEAGTRAKTSDFPQGLSR